MGRLTRITWDQGLSGAAQPVLRSGRARGGRLAWPFGKSMKIDAIRETPQATVVEVHVRWDAFGCFESIREVQLWDIVKVPRSTRPVELVIKTSTGPGCDTGIPDLPQQPPRVEHEIRIGELERDRYFVCEATGRISRIFESCAARLTID